MKKFCFSVLLFTLSAVSAQAQLTPEQAVNKAQDQFFDIKKRSVELERMKREAKKRPAGEDLSSGFPKIKEDFEEIQKINNEIFQITKAQSPTNYAGLLEPVTEINHRAERLKSNLFSSKTKDEKNEKAESVETPDIKELLETLDKAIIRFAHNPMFQNLKLVNAGDSLKAQKDLEIIINVSAAIREILKN